MKEECDYCLKQTEHGGKCNGYYSSNPCLYYEKDNRGKWIIHKTKIPIPFKEPIPKPLEEIKVTISDKDKLAKIYKIHKVEWLEGLQIGIMLYVDLGYWSDENLTDSNKFIFKVLRGGIQNDIE